MSETESRQLNYIAIFNEILEVKFVT